MVADVQRRYGRIDAVVHGAGVIEDALIVDKTAASFDRVVQTKVHPLLTLASLLDPGQLKLAMLFSSIAGFFGNSGQADYAAANEMLNRMACRLNDLWPGRVVAMNWGPWEGAGMVRPEVARHLSDRGIGLLSPEAGRLAAWQELLHRAKGDVCVVIGAADDSGRLHPAQWTFAGSREQGAESLART